jgi:hypothetical protein
LPKIAWSILPLHGRKAPIEQPMPLVEPVFRLEAARLEVMEGLTMANRRTTDIGEEYLQGDLFTGGWSAKTPKRGNGSHILLTAVAGGMAGYVGEGPSGKYCKDCAYFGVVGVQRGADSEERNPAACVLCCQTPKASWFS